MLSAQQKNILWQTPLNSPSPPPLTHFASTNDRPTLHLPPASTHAHTLNNLEVTVVTRCSLGIRVTLVWPLCDPYKQGHNHKLPGVKGHKRGNEITAVISIRSLHSSHRRRKLTWILLEGKLPPLEFFPLFSFLIAVGNLYNFSRGSDVKIL